MFNPESTGIMSNLKCSSTSKIVNLQAVDYCLWALQRFYVRNEETYLKLIYPCVSMIQEMDSKSGAKFGEIYTKKKHPLWGAKSTEDIGSK
jgi:hypothetical protein